MTISTKSYTTTIAIQNNASRGKALAEKFDYKIQPVVKSLDQDVSLEEVKKLYHFFVMNEKNYDPKKRLATEQIDKSTAEWLANGGSAAFAWCRMILKSENILKSYKKEITDQELNSEDDLIDVKLPVAKATNEELRQVTYVAMIPDHTDLHGDFTSAEEVRKAKESFNGSLQKANLFHLVMTDTFDIIESYLAPTDFALGDNFVKKGTWLVTLQVYDDDLWELIKSGDINGVSIGALANIEDIEEDEDD